MNAIRKGKYVEVKDSDGKSVTCKVLKKTGSLFETYYPVKYVDGKTHMMKVSLKCTDVIKVLD